MLFPQKTQAKVYTLLAAVAAVAAVIFFCRSQNEPVAPKPPHTIYGIGYVRGAGQTTLKNKYAGFVSQVNFFSQQRVKKGDVILQYDDFEIRKKISEKKQEILLQIKDIEEKKLQLALKKLDPLPSAYRNLDYKRKSARALVLRLEHEKEVYERLYQANCVSNLDWQEKKQSLLSSEAELKQIEEDQKKVRHGLSGLYIKISEVELQTAEQKLIHLKQDLEFLEEERKYYRIVAPFDGLCITKSDSVHGYYGAGTSAAIVHRDAKKQIYAYFQEDDIGLIKENTTCLFRSNQYRGNDALFRIEAFEVEKNRYSYGDKCYFLVKFRVLEEHKLLRIDSTGRVEITIPSENGMDGEDRRQADGLHYAARR